jgi:hypothetical protein
MGNVNDLANQILADAVSDFLTKNLGSDALRQEYEGPSIAGLETKFCANGSYSKVDFDLALKHLEDSKFLKTGPREVYENPPHSQVVMIGLFSKRKFVRLTEEGYKAAQKSPVKPRSSAPNIHISGTFHHSPIGVGSNVNQAVSYNRASDRLFVQLREAAGSVDDESERAEILAKLDQLQRNQGSAGFLDAYQKFIASVADYMTIFGPLIPALTQLLSGR